MQKPWEEFNPESELYERMYGNLEHLLKIVYKDPKEKKPILDIGGGNGLVALILASRFEKEVTVLDPSDYMIEAGEESAKKYNISNIRFCKGTMLELPEEIEGSEYDLILMRLTLSFIEEKEETFERIKEVMSDTSLFIIEEPPYDEEIIWSDTRLNKDSAEFDEGRYKRKIKKLKRSHDFIKEQKTFEIVAHLYKSVYILKKK